MTDLTLEEKRVNQEEAKSAEAEIRELTTQYNIKISKLLSDLEEEVDQSVSTGDWIGELEEFEANLIVDVTSRFESM